MHLYVQYNVHLHVWWYTLQMVLTCLMWSGPPMISAPDVATSAMLVSYGQHGTHQELAINNYWHFTPSLEPRREGESS